MGSKETKSKFDYSPEDIIISGWVITKVPTWRLQLYLKTGEGVASQHTPGLKWGLWEGAFLATLSPRSMTVYVRNK